MKSGFDYRIGPGMSSLLMIFVVLCMAVLAVLTLACVQVDSALNAKSRAATTSYYQAAAEVQRNLKALDAQLVHSRSEANGDVHAYIQQLMTLNGADGGAVIDEDTGEWTLRIAAPMGTDMHLEAVVVLPVVLEGKTYVLRSHQVVQDKAWDAPQNIGYYQRPE